MSVLAVRSAPGRERAACKRPAIALSDGHLQSGQSEVNKHGRDERQELAGKRGVCAT